MDERITTAVCGNAAGSRLQPNGNLMHCPCEYVPGGPQFGQVWDIGGLIAPRRLLTITAPKDSRNPAIVVQRAVDELQRIYAVAEAPGHYEHRFGNGTQGLDKNLTWEFIAKALREHRH